MKLTSGTIWKQMLRFYFPILAGSIIQLLYNTADSVMVGIYVGADALAAVGGTTANLFGMVIGMFTGIASGGTVLIGRYFGAEKNEDVTGAVQTSLCFSLLGGVIIGIIGYLATPYLLGLMNTPEGEIMKQATNYMRITFCGTVAGLLYNMGAGILRALGDSKTPMFLGMISGALNVVLNFLFILVFHMGVNGVAYATIISQIVSAVLVLRLLQKNEHCRITKWIRPYINWSYLSQILQIGMPTGLQTIMYAVSNGVVQANINNFEINQPGTMAAWAAYGRIVQLYWSTMAAMGMTVTTFVSQNYGAGDGVRIKKGVKTGLLFCLGITVSMIAVFNLLPEVLIGLFTTDTEVLSIGVDMIKLLSVFLITYVCVEVFTGALRGLGYTFGTTLITLITVCVLSVVWVEVASYTFGTLDSVLMVFPATWSITSVSLVWYYLYKSKKCNL